MLCLFTIITIVRDIIIVEVQVIRVRIIVSLRAIIKIVIIFFVPHIGEVHSDLTSLRERINRLNDLSARIGRGCPFLPIKHPAAHGQTVEEQLTSLYIASWLGSNDTCGPGFQRIVMAFSMNLYIFAKFSTDMLVVINFGSSKLFSWLYTLGNTILGRG